MTLPAFSFLQVFRARLRNFPSLVNCCTIDWFDPWPDEALRAVGRAKLENVELEPQRQADGPPAHRRKGTGHAREGMQRGRRLE